MLSVEQLAAWIELHRRVGDAKLSALLQQDPGNTVEAILSQHGGKTTSTGSRRLANELATRNVQILLLTFPDYPPRLRETLGPQAPPVLYAAGKLGLLTRRAFAIIGTRRPTSFGRTAAKRYAEQFALSGWTIVSGNAPGIDSAAHEAALAFGGSTIVFPPVPLDQFTPSFATSAPRASAEMLVLSPFVPGSKVEPYCFLQRNTLVAAHCRGALIAETGTRGGTLDTVRKLRQMVRPTWITQLPPSASHYNAHHLLLAGGALPAALQPQPKDLVMMQKNMTRQITSAPPASATFLLEDSV